MQALTTVDDESLPSRVDETGLAVVAPPRRSKLIELLPAIYSSDDFMARFLCIFEDTFTPIQQMANSMAYYFNPLVASSEMVDWLATWVNLTLDDSWPLEKRRRLIYSATELYSWRGTKRGLIEYLRLYTGIEPDIAEYVDGMSLGPNTRLGENTTIAGRERHSFTVTLRLPDLNESDRAFKELNIRRIIEAEKPVHTAYRLRLLSATPPVLEEQAATTDTNS
jgi:phage tail-like protein